MIQIIIYILDGFEFEAFDSVGLQAFFNDFVVTCELHIEVLASLLVDPCQTVFENRIKAEPSAIN